MPSGAGSLRTRAGYGVGALGIAIVYQALGTLLIYFYTNVVGLPPAQAGLIVFISTIWDGLVDPLVAWAASRTRSRFGQYRPWLIYASFPTGLCLVLMFYRPDWPLHDLVIYTLATSLVFRTLFQAVYLPFVALIGQLTGDAAERARLAGWKGWFTAVGQLVVSFFALTLIDALGHGNDRLGFLLTATLFSVIVSISLFTAGVMVRERNLTANPQSVDATSLGLALRHMARNPPFLWVMAAAITFGAAYALLANMTVYFFQYNLHSRVDARWALGALSGAGLLASPLWSIVAVRHGKRFVWMAGALAAAASLIALFVLNPRSLPVVAGFYGLIGLGVQPIIMMQFAAMADAIDYGEWKTGVRVSSFSFGAITLCSKAAMAIGGGSTGAILAMIGFTPKIEPSPGQIDAMRIAMMIAPAAILLVSAAMISRFKVTSEVHRELRADLDARTLR